MIVYHKVNKYHRSTTSLSQIRALLAKSRNERGYDSAWVKVRYQLMEREEGEFQRCTCVGHT